MLRTERLEFRNYTRSDKRLLAELFTDPVVMRHVDQGPLTESGVNKLWTRLIDEMYASGLNTIWAMFAREDGRFIGHGSIRPRPSHPEEWEIGYILSANEWGKGYATEAARAIVTYGFEHLGLEAVFATVDDDHEMSIRVLEKCGMKFDRFEFDEQGRYSVYAVFRHEVDTGT